LVNSGYVPDRGDFVWITLDPRTGHEQAGRRPGLILSPRAYNELPRHLAILCPLTTKAKGYPFEVRVPADSGATGVIIADQVRSVDWIARRAESMGRANESTIREVLMLIAALVGL
jgi:mRNA interferase MazF